MPEVAEARLCNIDYNTRAAAYTRDVDEFLDILEVDDMDMDDEYLQELDEAQVGVATARQGGEWCENKSS